MQPHGSIWKKKEPLTSKKQENKHAAEIFKLFEAGYVRLQGSYALPWASEEGTGVARGNSLADWATKEAAKGTFINAFGTCSRFITT